MLDNTNFFEREDKVPFLKEGDFFELKKGDSFYADLPKQLIYDNNDFDFGIVPGEVHIDGIRRGMDTRIFEGIYFVTKTSFDGGGYGHGVHDVYLDGHRVTAKRVIKDVTKRDDILSRFEIYFYQSGCFTCMNKNIQALKTPINLVEKRPYE